MCVFINSAEIALESPSQAEAEEPAQPSDEASLPSTSQEPSSSSAGTHSHACTLVLLYL